MIVGFAFSVGTIALVDFRHSAGACGARPGADRLGNLFLDLGGLVVMVLFGPDAFSVGPR